VGQGRAVPATTELIAGRWRSSNEGRESGTGGCLFLLGFVLAYLRTICRPALLPGRPFERRRGGLTMDRKVRRKWTTDLARRWAGAGIFPCLRGEDPLPPHRAAWSIRVPTTKPGFRGEFRSNNNVVWAWRPMGSAVRRTSQGKHLIGT